MPPETPKNCLGHSSKGTTPNRSANWLGRSGETLIVPRIEWPQRRWLEGALGMSDRLTNSDSFSHRHDFSAERTWVAGSLQRTDMDRLSTIVAGQAIFSIQT